MTGQKPKHVPERKCISCGKHLPKAEMIRVVRTTEGVPIIDRSGKADGRGAYLCGSKECFVSAKKARRLDRALSVKIPESLYEEISEIREEGGGA